VTGFLTGVQWWEAGTGQCLQGCVRRGYDQSQMTRARPRSCTVARSQTHNQKPASLPTRSMIERSQAGPRQGDSSAIASQQPCCLVRLPKSPPTTPAPRTSTASPSLG
jgi:hypothetical protein